MRTLAVSLVAVALFVVGCSSTPTKKTPTSLGGGGGADQPAAGAPGAGSGGAGGAGGGAAGAGGGSGSTDASAAGGSAGGGSGGSSGSGGSVTDASADVPARRPDASADASSTGGTDLAGIPGHEWVIPCQPGWSRDQCCMHYCTCMTTNCPARAPANCLATCTAPGNNWNLKCKVEQCFESLDPRYPMDKNSHCGHATEPAHCQGIIP